MRVCHRFELYHGNLHFGDLVNLVQLKKSFAINRIHHKCVAKQDVFGLSGILQSYTMLFLLIVFRLI